MLLLHTTDRFPVGPVLPTVDDELGRFVESHLRLVPEYPLLRSDSNIKSLFLGLPNRVSELLALLLQPIDPPVSMVKTFIHCKFALYTTVK